MFPDLPTPLPSHMLVIHIPLIDFIEENGSTELWPGTHLVTDHWETLDPDGDGDGASGEPEERALSLPSIRANMPAGSTLVRDMQVWHRAVPNHTDQRRTMLSLVYHRHCPSLGYQPKASDPVDDRILDQLSERAQRILLIQSSIVGENLRRRPWTIITRLIP
jgi:ectoine hydroxylase-related dioxygenase (phytanoyl-CoA dioxygenase family)